MTRHFTSLSVALTIVTFGCSAPPAGASPADGAAPSPVVSVDAVEIVAGVPDRGRDPAVLAIDVGGQGLCSGALIAPNVVLTARHCVADTSEEVSCPSRAPQVRRDRPASSLAAYAGDDLAHLELLGRGVELVVPEGDVLCDQDVALIVLDREAAGIEPLAIQRAKIAKGDRVRAVGFGKRGDQEPAGTKLLRDHVAVLDVSRAEFLVGEATCQGDSGGPALDEGTGDIVGVVSRGGPTCEGKGTHNIYTQVAPFLELVDSAMQRGKLRATGGGPTRGDAGSTSHQRPPTDMGAGCGTAADCSTGVCIKGALKPPAASALQYCSRTCGHGDRCPTHFHCEAHAGAPSVCVQS